MSGFSGNTMELRHFHDFYVLEAMIAQVGIAKSKNPEWQFRHSVERLENDLQDAFSTLCHEMAFRIYVYLWASALGEARHTGGSYLKMNVEELHGGNRSDVYKKALQYFPSDKNVQIIKKIFAQSGWGSSYGGKAWLSIVEGMELYGKVSDATFIDHAVDLEHNGGCVFNKDAKFGLDCWKSHKDGYSTYQMKSFLDFKFSKNVLKDIFSASRVETLLVSTKVYNLFGRFINVIAETFEDKLDYSVAKRFMEPKLEWLSGYSVEWDTKEFTLRGETKETPKTETVKKTVKKTGSVMAKVIDNGLFPCANNVGKTFEFVSIEDEWYGTLWVSQDIVTTSGYMWKFASRQLEFIETKEENHDGKVQLKVKEDASKIKTDIYWSKQMDVLQGKTLWFSKRTYSQYYQYNDGTDWIFSPEWLESPQKTKKGKIMYSVKSEFNGTVHEFYREDDSYITDDVMGGGGNKGHWLFYPSSIDFNYRNEREDRPFSYCEDCECRLAEDDIFLSDSGNSYCQNCYDEKYFHCENCQNETRIDDSFYSSVDDNAYCRDCYNRKFVQCGKCHKRLEKEYAVDAEHHHKYYWLCRRCAELEMAKCEVCEEWYELEEMTYMEDTYEYQCQHHAIGKYCRKCNEYHDDIRYHNKHVHPRRPEYRPVELTVDGDGVFEVVRPFQWEVPQNTIGTGWYGGVMETKMYGSKGEWTVTAIVLKHKDVKGLCLVDLATFNKETGRYQFARDGKSKWTITAENVGCHIFSEYKDLNTLKGLMLAIGKAIDWTKVDNREYFYGQHRDEKKLIYEAKNKFFAEEK